MRVKRKSQRKVSRKQKNRYAISFGGVAPVLQQAWDRAKTLRQNYEAFGLVASLNGTAGGTGREAAAVVEAQRRMEVLKSALEWRDPGDLHRSLKDDPVEGRFISASTGDIIVKHPIDGTILVDKRVNRIGSKISAKWVSQPTAPSHTNGNPIVKQLEAEAADPIKLPRHVSEQEYLMFLDLVKKHAFDYAAMSQDMRLNKYQLTAGQLKRKIHKVIPQSKATPVDS